MRRPRHLFLLILCCGLLVKADVGNHTQNDRPAEESCPNDETVVERDSLAYPLVSWIRSEGGVFNTKLGIRQVRSGDASSIHGVIANEDIQRGEIILEVPRHLLFSLEDETEEDRTEIDFNCDVVEAFAEELRLGSESQYAPYLDYLLEARRRSTIPSAWSDAGKNLLTLVVGRNGDNEEYLPPYSPFRWKEEGWREECDGSDDPLEEFSVMLFAQLERKSLLIPGYDLIRHRNGRWLNTESDDPRNEELSFKVTASRDIMAGEEVYISEYSFESSEPYGTPEILCDQGFVEQYPQRWVFEDELMGFDIDTVYGNDGAAMEGYVLTELKGFGPINDNLEFLKEQRRRLRKVKTTALASRAEDNPVPESEWKVIVEYHEAILLAISLAIKIISEEQNICDFGRYVDLNEKPDGFDLNGYMDETCNGYFFPWYPEIEEEELESIESAYQKIFFSRDVESEDTCLSLDNIVQICASYRPHYHEMVVHNTARFLDKIKRVVFVGGGDSMLLHEIVKYPSLELVVGLELDQKVTRNSFKYFGTQPHYDNEKVQWWYGDASKSLLMLPDDYFGSFDMVLVDLSETVMSMKVTDGLDILQALTLLLKPDGIFVKNEIYFNTMRKMFKYSTMIRWYDNPVICAQVLVLGSNEIDFMDHDLKDHHIDALFLEPFDAIHDPYELYHDYYKNESSAILCKEDQHEPEEELTEQVSSPGILMIVEAEETTVELKPSEVKSNFVKALEKEGLTVVSAVTSRSDVSGATVALILREGYVMARMIPEHNYCAFDIHLWSNFRKHENIKKALIAVVGSQSLSSFRIVAGGMFGVSTWRDDTKERGPHFTQACDRRDDASITDDPVEQSTIDHFLKDFVNLAMDDGLSAAVICGEDTEGCSSLRILEEQEGIGDVIPLSCSIIKNISKEKEGAIGRELACEHSTQMNDCEQELVRTLRESIAKEGLGVIVVDSSASEATAKILHRIFDYDADGLVGEIFAPSVLVFSAMSGENETWRRNFVRKFMKDVFYEEPAYNAEVIFNSSDASFEVDVSSSGDFNFIQKLKNLSKTIKAQSNFVPYFQEIMGGYWSVQEDFVASHPFGLDDYNSSFPMKQWTSQNPLGYQNVFQFESMTTDLSTPLIRRAFDSTLANLSPSLIPSSETAEVHEFTEIGNGCVMLALWSGGNAIVTWDGNVHVDINLFMNKENTEEAEKFKRAFSMKVSSLSSTLHDEHPRGIGRVVNFSKDILPKVKPNWA